VRSVDELLARLRERGGKITPQRVLIYTMLAGDRTHPTAESLHRRLQEVLPHLSLTTVYAALNDLVTAGEIRAFEAGDGQLHYDPDLRPHAELVCVRCHSITDAPLAPEEAVVPERVGDFEVFAQTLLLHGLCSACRTALAEEGSA
jgi:Fur family peroxide stress response transcriptional regulator